VQRARNLLLDLEDAGTGEVRAARQGRHLHAGVRCRVPGSGRQGNPLRGPGAADEIRSCNGGSAAAGGSCWTAP
jgi:hypothetical protein